MRRVGEFELKGLVLAGGEGTRLRPFTLSTPKHLIPLLGKAVVEYPITHLIEAGIRDIGIVVGYLGTLIKEYLGDGSRYNARFTYIQQEKRQGIAHAINLAIEEGFIDQPFIVYLGDNILASGIKEFAERFRDDDADVFIMLTRVKDPQRFGVAVIKDGRIKTLIEKPKEPISNLAMIGIYFFRDPALVRKAYSTLKPSWRGEYEITELIQWFIHNGYDVKYVTVKGWWKDVGTPEGLLDALYLLLDNLEARNDGKVNGETMGRVYVEKDAVVEGTVYGPAYIGSKAYIGERTTIDHYVSVEANSIINSGFLTRTLILSNTTVDINMLRLVDSVVGRHSVIDCNRELHGNIRLVISDYSKVFI